MGNVNIELLDFMKKDLKDALHNSGHYTFSDKGAHEVCFMATNQLRKLPVEDAVATLQAFFDVSTKARQYVQDQIVSLDDWDELFDESAPWAKFITDNY